MVAIEGIREYLNREEEPENVRLKITIEVMENLMKRILAILGITALLVAFGTPAFAASHAKKNPCAAKNPCAVKKVNPCAAKKAEEMKDKAKAANPCAAKKADEMKDKMKK